MYVRLFFVAVLVAVIVAHRNPANATQSHSATIARGTPASTTDTVIVNLGVIKQSISPTFFGINYVGFWDQAQGSAASARALSQTAIRTVRFPGGAPSDWYDWQDPYYKQWSTTSPLQLWRYARSFGATHVVFGTNFQGNLPNPPGKTYTVNSPENAAAWVQYDKKVGISADMEVGNEEDMKTLTKKSDPAYAPYIAGFSAQAKAMHQEDRHVRVLGPTGVNEYYWWGLDGLGMFLTGAGNRTGSGQVDGVSLHFYKGSAWLNSRGVAQYWLSQDGPWTAIQKAIRAHDTRKLPVYITEWNVGGSEQNSPFMPTLGHALVTADMIGAFARSGVAGEDYFDLHGVRGWGLLYAQGEDRPVDNPTPTYYAMALWSHMGNRMVDLQQSDDAASVMSTYATRRSDGSVQVLAINKQPSPRRVTVELQGATPSGHHFRVYSLRGAGGSVDDRNAVYDGVSMPSPQHRLPGATNEGVVRGRTVSYTVPGYSAVVLDLDRVSRAPRIKWKPLPPPTPAPALSVTVTGKVGHVALRPGETQSLVAIVRSNQDVGSVLMDFEVYDSAGSKVFQDTQSANLAAGKAITASRTYTISTLAHAGNYTYKIGIFGPNWSPLYVWNDNASRFTVTAPAAK